MKPQELASYLATLVNREVKISTMIWGAPGIGKSSIVQQVGDMFGMPVIDVRLSQLAPTDLRGLPSADKEARISRWLPPEFLPREGCGILFLDELNLAPPVMQGMAQQLILDRRVGSYVVPDGWYIWAAGNRKEDRAAVFDMPAPLANRFLHLEVEADLEGFKDWALTTGINERVIAFLAFKPSLLHKIDPQHPTWPSPRSWSMASHLLNVGLDPAPAIGAAATAEYNAYCAVYANLPDIDAIMAGKGSKIKFPSEPSARYATVIALTVRGIEGEDRAFHSFGWLIEKATSEWVQLFAADLFTVMRAKQLMGKLAAMITKDPRMTGFLAEYQQLLKGVN